MRGIVVPPDDSGFGEALRYARERSAAESKLRYSAGIDNRAAIVLTAAPDSSMRVFEEIPRPQYPDGAPQSRRDQMEMVIGITFDDVQVRDLFSYLTEA